MSFPTTKLGSVCEIIAGQSPPSSTYNSSGDGLPFFQGKADFGIQFPKVRLWCNDPNKIAKPNDILLSVRAPVGPTNICDVESCIGRGLAAIRSNGKTDYKYVYYYFKHIENKLANAGNGSTFSAITVGDVKSLDIPLPPLSTQQKIAAILDKADTLRRKDKQLFLKYDALLQSIFYKMFGDPVKNNKKWNKTKVKSIGKVITGNTPPRDIVKYYGSFIEWIKTDNILPEQLNPVKSKEYLSSVGATIGRLAPVNSILVTCIAGSPTTIGNVCFVDRDVAFNQQINALVPSKNHNPLFVYFLFFFSKRLVQNSTTKGMKRIITKSVFENLEVINPPLEIQDEFAESIIKAVKIREQARILLDKSEALFQTLLQKAFKGELVS